VALCFFFFFFACLACFPSGGTPLPPPHMSSPALVCAWWMLLDRTVALVSHSGEATRIEVVSTLNLADQGSRWISTSVFGNVYSFLSENILWFGSVQGTDINIAGARVSSPHHMARRFSSRHSHPHNTHTHTTPDTARVPTQLGRHHRVRLQPSDRSQHR
jgi:hypothetical protein